LKWETPVGYVEFPDGFQFTLFEYIDGDMATEESAAEQALEKIIIDNKEAYAEEYQEVQNKVDQLIYDPQIAEKIYSGNHLNHLQQEHAKSQRGISKTLKNIFKTKTWLESLTPLSYEDFALLKARIMVAKAAHLYNLGKFQKGYATSDKDGLGFRVTEGENGKPDLEAIGFDFEYYEKINPEDLAFKKKVLQKEQDRFFNSPRNAFKPGGASLSIPQQIALSLLLEKETLPEIQNT
jgi:hypothetical protein